MPTYSFYCDSCKKKFEIFCSIAEYSDNQECKCCNKSESVNRLYTEDLSTLSTSIKKHDSELKTIGDLANRNRDRMSEDQKIALSSKHNSYKEQQSNKQLPKGMSRMQRPKNKIKWRKNG